jgi:predicted nucleotidyltransferase
MLDIMKPSLRLHVHRDDIRRIVQANRGANPRVFGSVARGEDTEASDLDLLIDATPELSLFDIARMALAIERVVSSRVDVRTIDDLPPRIRNRVAAEAQPV